MTGLLRIFFFLMAFLILRGLVRRVFLGTRPGSPPPTTRPGPGADVHPVQDLGAPSQEIEEAEYEELD